MLDINLVSDNFIWQGEGYSLDRRKRHELHYKAFKCGDLRIQLEDYVLIRNDESLEPEGHIHCFIAQLKDLYESDENTDEPHRAVVQWFSRIVELPPNFSKLIQNADYHHEVVEEHRPLWSSVIDAESIFGKCCVILLAPSVNPKNFARKNSSNIGIPVFYCRWKFTGRTFKPKIQDTNTALMKTNNRNRSHSKIWLMNNDNDFSCPPIKNNSRTLSPAEFVTNPSPPKKTKSLVKKSKTARKCTTNLNTGVVDDFYAIDKETHTEITEGKSLLFSPSVEASEPDQSNQDKIKTCGTPVKKFYSPTKKPSRVITNSPRLSSKFFESQSAGLERSTSTGESKSILDEGEVPKRGNKIPDEEECIVSAVRVRRSLFPTSLTDLPMASKQKSKYCFAEQDMKDQNQVVTTRYGRKVKPVYSQSLTDNVEYQDAIMPKSPKKSSAKPKLKFYNPDVSDCESSYSPSSKSYSEEDSNDDEMSVKHGKTPRSRKSLSSQKKIPKRRMRAKTAVPEIPVRLKPLRTPQNHLEMCRQRLHVSAVPKSLPCREDEYNDIYTFVESNLLNNTGGCMYISGVPGTGKTATAFEVMRNLQKERDHGNIPQFKFVEVNGMRMTEPHQCYVQIYKVLSGETVAPQQAADLLEKRFIKPGLRKDPVVLLVDELDLLWTRKQTVMYNIFDWPSKPNSKLIVIAIANAMDLPERLMLTRISSRLGLTRRTFQPYTFKQLQEIVMCRINELQIFDSDAVQLVARKVAALSGDARRALDVCRRAVEIAEDGKVQISPHKRRSTTLVGIGHVDLALQEMFTSPMIMAIRSSSDMQKHFLRCVVAEFLATGLEETFLSKVHRNLIDVCVYEGIRPPNTSQTFALCSLLASSRLILVDSSENDIYQKIRLNVSVDDVNYALNEKRT